MLPNQTQITTDSKRTSRTISLANVLPTNIIVCKIIRGIVLEIKLLSNTQSSVSNFARKNQIE